MNSFRTNKKGSSNLILDDPFLLFINPEMITAQRHSKNLKSLPHIFDG